MRAPVAPRLETRRTAEFSAELRDRARAWIPEWDLSAGQGDFGQALLDVSARFSSEVAERLDQAGEKMRRGFLDWLGVRGKAARPARVPVVFKLSDSAQSPVDAVAPVRLQASAGAIPVVFETEKSLTIIPAKLQMIVAADPTGDAYFLPPPGLSTLAAADHLPTQWTVKSFAPANTTSLQLMPGVGLSAGVVIELNGSQYTITAPDKDLVTIDPPLKIAAAAGTEVVKVTSFTLFDPAAANQQEHILYIGDADLLNVEASGIIGVQNAAGLSSGVTWQYWGKADTDAVTWQPLTVLPTPVDMAGMLLLQKAAGSIEQLDSINGHNARWIRAYAKTVPASQPPFTTSHLAIEINPSAGCKLGPCPPPDGTPSIQADGLANTTPLVLNNLFYPLGKEPHQFDAFYLGSNEAFSKSGAKVQLCFEMADRTFNALSAVRGINFGASQVLVGVGHDRALHLSELDPSMGKVSPFRGRPPLYPPSPAFGGGPVPGSAVSLDKDATWRPQVWTSPGFVPGFAAAVCADSTVWVWLEHPFVVGSGWVNFGQVPSTTTPAPNISSLIVLNEAAGVTNFFALREFKLYRRDWPLPNPDWSEKATTDGGATVRLVSIVAVRNFTSGGGLFNETGTAEMVGIDDNGKLFQVAASGGCTPRLPARTFNKTILPAAVKLDGTFMVAAVIDDQSDIKLTVLRDGLPEVETKIPNRRALRALEAVLDGGRLHVLLTATDGNTQTLYDWVPFDVGWTTTPNDLFAVAIDAGITDAGPTEVDRVVAVPGNRADILSATYDATRRFDSKATIDPGVVVSSALSFVAGDYVTRVKGGKVQGRKIQTVLASKDGETLYRLDGPFDPGSEGLDAYPQANQKSGSWDSVNLLWQLDAGDNTTIIGGYIQILSGFGASFHRVDSITTTLPFQASLTPEPTIPGPGLYIPGIATNGRFVPLMNPVPGTWTADALDRPVGFPADDPTSQFAKPFDVNPSNNHPTQLAFNREFNPPFNWNNPHRFVIEAAFGEWHRDAGGSTNNPELSWEYWNGKGWSRLKLDRDETLNLQITGAVQFSVPADIAPSDWAGKTNPWIRARLIGGDYGREKFITTGTITTRSTDDIHPPSVVNLTISYQLCTAVSPAFVLTSDSGSLLDQSNANRSSSANVEAFVPLAVTLSRLLQPTTSGTDPSANPCPPLCNCPGETKAVGAQPASVAPSATGSAPANASTSTDPF